MTPLAVLLEMAFGWIVMQFPGGSSAAVVANLKMPADGTGLIAAFEDAEGATDQRVDFRAALYVSADEPATPFLTPGPFNATWRGQLNVPMRDRYHFAFEGSGTFTLTINDEVVLSVDDAQAGERIISGPVRLDQGPNEIVAEYASPPSADAAVRLLWSSPDFPLEPVSPSVFTYDQSHGNDETLHERQQVREGRALMAEHRCIRCHTAPNGLIGDAAMPELMMDAPAIMDVGLRLHEPWMAEWIADPEAVRHDATMPKFFHGETGEQQAKDVAAYLATLRFGAVAEASTPVPSDADTIEAGGHLYASLGCVGCHELRDQEPVADRISLAQIGQKFAGPALREFLRNPAQRYAHTRMGDFDLSRDEADAVAAFLLDQSLEPAENYEPGDATRGQALVQQNGCINCHALPVPSTMEVPAMQALMQADWSTGCLAEDAAARGTAPEIPLNGAERDALRALKGAGLASLSQHNKMEFAQRQMHRLSCNACHELGGKRD
ncbi:MAG: c-type cytochrome, partial [Phycisphaeraceae bacterium]